MDIDSFYKTNAHACLYKANTANVNGYQAEDITITLVLYEYSRQMIKIKDEKNCRNHHCEIGRKIRDCETNL